MKLPTPREKDLLQFINAYQASKGCAPTREEMGEALKVSKTRAVQLLSDLLVKALVERRELAHRSVQLTTAGLKAIGVKKAA